MTLKQPVAPTMPLASPSKKRGLRILILGGCGGCLAVVACVSVTMGLLLVVTKPMEPIDPPSSFWMLNSTPTQVSLLLPTYTLTAIPTTTPSSMATNTPTTVPKTTASPAATHTLTIAPTWTRRPVSPTPTTTIASIGCPGSWDNFLFFDDFGNPRSGWTNYKGADYEHFYENGEFHFSVTRKDFTGNAWIQLRDLGTRYLVEAQMRKIDGPEMNNYGLLFGGQNDTNYYTFGISDVGSYRISEQVDGRWQDLVAWTKTPLINQGGLNALGVRIQDTQITACVNGHVLITLNDPPLKSGRVGLVAGAYDEPVHYQFDNFGVWKLD